MTNLKNGNPFRPEPPDKEPGEGPWGPYAICIFRFTDPDADTD
jgi:hypothetical protein